MKPIALRQIAWTLGLALAGCASEPPAPGAPHEMPALRAPDDAQLHLQIERTMSDMLHVPLVTLPDDIFVRSNVYALPATAVRAPDGGMAITMSHFFNLIRIGNVCVLVDRSTGARRPMPGATCRVSDDR